MTCLFFSQRHSDPDRKRPQGQAQGRQAGLDPACGLEIRAL